MGVRSTGSGHQLKGLRCSPSATAMEGSAGGITQVVAKDGWAPLTHASSAMQQ
jgi:hypothetical protein